MAEMKEAIADIIAEMRKSDRDKICPWWADGGSCDLCPLGRNGKNCSFSNYADRIEAAWKREITILRDTLAEVIASIEVRFPAIEYALDRKPYLDAKKILEKYKEEIALATTSNQTTQED